MPSSGRAVRWRTVDIVVTAVLGVAFGVVFWAWNLVFGVLAAPLDFFPPVSAILNGVWLMPGVVARLLVRKPGAARVRLDPRRRRQPAAGLAVRPDHRRVRPGPGRWRASSASLLFRYRRFGWPQALLAAATAGLSTRSST